MTLNLCYFIPCFSIPPPLSFCLPSFSCDTPSLSCTAVSLPHLFPLHNISRRSKRMSWEEHEQVRDFLNRMAPSSNLWCLSLQNVPIDLERSIRGRQGLCFHNTVYYYYCSEKKDLMNARSWQI